MIKKIAYSYFALMALSRALSVLPIQTPKPTPKRPAIAESRCTRGLTAIEIKEFCQ